MKYIRTEDGVYEIDEYWLENESEDALVPYFRKEENSEYYAFRKDIKIADTIEELCEIFVINFGKIKHFCYNFKDLNNYAEYKNVYGGIWLNEWGLKYVAKLNEKGELELL